MASDIGLCYINGLREWCKQHVTNPNSFKDCLAALEIIEESLDEKEARHPCLEVSPVKREIHRVTLCDFDLGEEPLD